MITLLVYSLFVATVASLLRHATGFSKPVLLWGAVEVLYFGVRKWIYQQCNEVSEEAPPCEDVDDTFERFLTLKDCICARDFLQGWFFNAPYEEIHEENVKEFLAYGFLYKRWEALDPSQREQVDCMFARLGREWGLKFPPGRNAKLRFMAHIFEDLNVHHRPIVVALAAEAASMFTHALALTLGFRAQQSGSFTYWTRDLPSIPSARPFEAAGPMPWGAGIDWQGFWRQQETRMPLLQRFLRLPVFRNFYDSMFNHQNLMDWRPRAAVGALLAWAGETGGGTTAPRAWRLPVVPSSLPAAMSAREQGQLLLAALPPTLQAAIGARIGQLQEYVWRLAAVLPAKRSASACDLSNSQVAVRLQLTCSLMRTRLAELRQMAASTASKLTAPMPTGEGGEKGEDGMLPGLRPWSAADMQAFEEVMDCFSWPFAPMGPAPAAPDASALQAVPPRTPSGAAADGRSGDAGGETGVADGTDAAAAGAAPDPVVFIHGVGFGLFPYLGFIWNLLSLLQRRRPVVLIEVPHVSLKLCQRALAVDEVAHNVMALLAAHGVQQAAFLGHSYGTFVISRICKLAPQMVQAICLVDPVCMLTCYPMLVHNFVYQGLSLDGLSKNPMDAVRWFAARDLLVAEAFCRRFFWGSLMLWPDQMPAGKTLLVLSERDNLVPGELVRRQVAVHEHQRQQQRQGGREGEDSDSAAIRVLSHPRLVHGMFLAVPSWQRHMLVEFSSMLH